MDAKIEAIFKYSAASTYYILGANSDSVRDAGHSRTTFFASSLPLNTVAVASRRRPTHEWIRWTISFLRPAGQSEIPLSCDGDQIKDVSEFACTARRRPRPSSPLR